MYGMTTIKAKVIDDFHLELEKGIPTKTGDEVFVKIVYQSQKDFHTRLMKMPEAFSYQIIEKKPVTSLRGAWGCDVDSAHFVDTLRKSRTIEPL